MRKIVLIIIALFLLLMTSFSVASESFYGTYQGNLEVESFNESLLQSLAENNNESVNALKQEIRESLAGDQSITITPTEGKNIVQLDGQGWIEANIQGSQISFKIILDEGVAIELKGQQDSSGNITGNLEIQTPLGSLASGSFKMNKTSSLEIPAEVEEDEKITEEENSPEENPSMEKDKPGAEKKPEDSLGEDTEVIVIEDIPIYEPANENFLPITNLEEEYKGAKEVTVQKTEGLLVDIYNDNSDVEIEEDLNGRLKIYKNDPADDLSYEKKKYIMKGSNIVLDKIVGETPVKYLVQSASNLLKDEIYDREDHLRDIQAKHDMNRLEARGYYDVNSYEDKEKILSPIKQYITDQEGVVGYTGGVVQKQLDKLANSKKKALGKAAGREYRNFAETYIESRKNGTHEEAVKAAYKRLEDLNYDAGANEGGEAYVTFKTSKSSFFKEPIKFLSHRILNRESKVKTLKERSSMYIGYLKEDNIYMDSEGGN